MKDSVSDSDLLHEGKFPLFECCIILHTFGQKLISMCMLEIANKNKDKYSPEIICLKCYVTATHVTKCKTLALRVC